MKKSFSYYLTRYDIGEGFDGVGNTDEIEELIENTKDSVTITIKKIGKLKEEFLFENYSDECGIGTIVYCNSELYKKITGKVKSSLQCKVDEIKIDKTKFYQFFDVITNITTIKMELTKNSIISALNKLCDTIGDNNAEYWEVLLSKHKTPTIYVDGNFISLKGDIFYKFCPKFLSYDINHFYIFRFKREDVIKTISEMRTHLHTLNDDLSVSLKNHIVLFDEPIYNCDKMFNDFVLFNELKPVDWTDSDIEKLVDFIIDLSYNLKIKFIFNGDENEDLLSITDNDTLQISLARDNLVPPKSVSREILGYILNLWIRGIE